MLVHHDNRPYEVAAKAAASEAKNRINSIIEKGKDRGKRVIDKVMAEVPTDHIVLGKALRFEPVQDKVDVCFGAGTELKIHPHALSQLCERVDMPAKYATMLLEEKWGPQLLATNLNELYSHKTSSKYLLRSYDKQLRGFLSDRFRRMDSRPLLDAFASACQQIGAVPVEGYASDTKVALKAMVPRIFEPVPNEVVAFGLMWENSDYGNGRLSIRAFMLRLWCTNYAITDAAISQVHLGKRLTDDVTWSDQTYALDTKALASATTDVVIQSLSEAHTTALCDAIRCAAEEKIDAKGIVETLKKRGLLKAELAKATEVFNSPEVELLPPGNTMWRMSNAISWLAANDPDIVDEERKLELMKVAGSLIRA